MELEDVCSDGCIASHCKTRNTFCGTRYLSYCRTKPVTFNLRSLIFLQLLLSFPTKHPALNCHHLGHVMWSLDSQYTISYWWSIWTNRLSRTVFEVSSLKNIWTMTLTFGFTWRHRSHDQWMRNVWLAIGAPLKPSLYVACGHVTDDVTWPKRSRK